MRTTALPSVLLAYQFCGGMRFCVFIHLSQLYRVVFRNHLTFGKHTLVEANRCVLEAWNG